MDMEQCRMLHDSMGRAAEAISTVLFSPVVKVVVRRGGSQCDVHWPGQGQCDGRWVLPASKKKAAVEVVCKYQEARNICSCSVAGASAAGILRSPVRLPAAAAPMTKASAAAPAAAVAGEETARPEPPGGEAAEQAPPPPPAAEAAAAQVQTLEPVAIPEAGRAAAPTAGEALATELAATAEAAMQEVEPTATSTAAAAPTMRRAAPPATAGGKGGEGIFL